MSNDTKLSAARILLKEYDDLLQELMKHADRAVTALTGSEDKSLQAIGVQVGEDAFLILQHSLMLESSEEFERIFEADAP
jgi:hypothetical protein